MLQPHLKIKKGDINKYCLLPGDPGRVLRIINYLNDVKKVSENRGYLIFNGKYKGVPVTVCSTGMGGPSIAIAIHELVNCGAKVLIRVGSCGALQPNLRTGDVIVPKGAVRSESTTCLYYPREHPAYPDNDVLKALSVRGTYVGFTNSHDGFYHKGNDEMDKFWSKIGLLASDFETAPLFIISEYLGVKAGSILYVVSEFHKSKKLNISYALKSSARALEGEARAIIIALNAIKKVEG